MTQCEAHAQLEATIGKIERMVGEILDALKGSLDGTKPGVQTRLCDHDSRIRFLEDCRMAVRRGTWDVVRPIITNFISAAVGAGIAVWTVR